MHFPELVEVLVLSPCVLRIQGTLPSVCTCVCRFSTEESVSSSGQVKSSVQRGIRSRILEAYPKIEGIIDDIMPKKSNLVLVKWYVGDRVVEALLPRAGQSVRELASRSSKESRPTARLLELLLCVRVPVSLPHNCHIHSQNHIQIVTLNKEPLFFCERDGPYYPTLRLLHKCKRIA